MVANTTQKVTSASTNPESSDGEQETGNKWFGHLPYLRLIHCLLEDDIKDRWIHRNDAKSIKQIDARRSDVRDEDAFEMIATRWNSATFNPRTMVSSCHSDFAQAIDIGFAATSDFVRATPTKVKDKLAKMKSDLTSIITKWERSGQGEGGILEYLDDEDEGSCVVSETSHDDVRQEKFQWGRSKGRKGAFDCRESFLGPNPSYILYFWDVLDQNDLFNTTINRLSDDAGASSPNHVPSVVRMKGKSSRTSDTEDVSVFMSNFCDVIIEASKDATIAAERRHQEAQEAEDKRVALKSNAAKNRMILQAQLENRGYLKRRIDNLQDEARKIRFKIFECKENKRETEEKFFSSELEIIQTEISNCNKELNNETVNNGI